MKEADGLNIRAEIHSVDFLRSDKFGIQKHQRLAVLRNYLDEISRMDFISLTNIVVDKRNKPADYDIFGTAWRTLFQRFENTLKHGNFPGADRESFGLVFTDATSGKKLSQIMRKMAVHNPIPNRQFDGYRNIPILRVVEDPSERDSKSSLPIQTCDVVAYFLKQKLAPNSYIRRKHATNYFDRLGPVLNTRASIIDPMGIIRL